MYTTREFAQQIKGQAESHLPAVPLSKRPEALREAAALLEMMAKEEEGCVDEEEG